MSVTKPDENTDRAPEVQPAPPAEAVPNDLVDPDIIAMDEAEPVLAGASRQPEEVSHATAGDDVADLRRRLDESLAREKRWLADFDNYRRRTERLFEDQAELRKRALATDFLDIVDDLTRALDHATEHEAALSHGVSAIREKLLASLARHGIKPFSPVHEPFDPATQEAVGIIQHPELDSGTVAHVERIGWKAGEKLLRPARVLVVKNGE